MACTEATPAATFTSSAAWHQANMTSSVITEIKVDHDNIRDLLERFKLAYGKKETSLMQDVVNTIVRESSVHSDAEEMSVYKMMDEHGMKETAEHDRIEHNEVKSAMTAIEGQSPDRLGLDKYAELVTKACQLFIRHAEDEENEQLPKLIGKVSAEQQVNATNVFLNARKLATTRPHPIAPQSGGLMQKAAEVMSKPLDTATQVMCNFVELKHKHAEPGQT